MKSKFKKLIGAIPRMADGGEMSPIMDVSPEDQQKLTGYLDAIPKQQQADIQDIQKPATLEDMDKYQGMMPIGSVAKVGAEAAPFIKEGFEAAGTAAKEKMPQLFNFLSPNEGALHEAKLGVTAALGKHGGQYWHPEVKMAQNRYNSILDLIDRHAAKTGGKFVD